MADEEVKVKLTLEDDFSDEAERAADATQHLDKGMDQLKQSTTEANVAFLTTLETIDKFGSSVSQLRGGLQDTGLVSDETAQSLLKVQGAVDILVGATQMYLTVGQMFKVLNLDITRTLKGVGFAAGAVATAYMAINAHSDEERAIFSTLTGITTALAAANFLLADAKLAATLAGYGPAAPFVAAAIVGAVAAGATYFASLKASAQTDVGEVRTVEKEGIIYAHQGETIGRVSEPQQAGFGTVQVQVNGYIQPVEPERLAQVIADAIRFGG
jgi:hypothetical protein